MKSHAYADVMTESVADSPKSSVKLTNSQLVWLTLIGQLYSWREGGERRNWPMMALDNIENAPLFLLHQLDAVLC